MPYMIRLQGCGGFTRLDNALDQYCARKEIVKMLNKEDFKHHLDNIENQSKWAEFYGSSAPEHRDLAQISVDMSKEILLKHFEETEKN